MSQRKHDNHDILIEADTGQEQPRDFLEFGLLNNYQRDFPLVDEPFARIAAELDTSVDKVLDRMQALQERGLVSRVGAVLRPNSVNASLLAAMAVPEDRMEEVANIVNACIEVNHNYEREHHFNLWFVLHAADEDRLHAVLDRIEEQTGLTALRLPILDDFHIDLGFALEWKQ